MGGKLTTDLAGIDKRIKAAVPSCGGSGDLLESEAVVPGGSRTKRTAMEAASISDNDSSRLSPARCFGCRQPTTSTGHIDNMAWKLRNVPDDRVRFSISRIRIIVIRTSTPLPSICGLKST